MKNIIRRIILETLISEDKQHIKKLFTNWANKKSGNPELALSLMDDFLKYQKKIKRDFSSFSSAEEMKQTIDQVRTSEAEKVKASDVNKIFENSDVLILAANTHEASCRYASGTKWCTGARDTDEYWKRHNRTGTEFIWIFKNIEQGNPNYKFSLHIKWDKKYDWCDAVNRCSPKIPTILTTQTSDVFTEYFNYEDIIQKCFQYHNKRYEEKIKNLGDVSELKKKILIYVQGELERDLENFYYATFDSDLEYKLGELDTNGLIDANEWENLSSEAFDFADTKKDEIVSKSLRNIIEDLSNISDEELAEEQEKMFGREGTMTNDQFIAKFIEDYMQVNGHEIMLEETSILVDDFLDSKGLSIYDIQESILKEEIYQPKYILYRAVGLDEAIKSCEVGHLVYYSKDPMSRDWEVIEYSLGDNADQMSDDEINQYINDLVPWTPNSKGVNLTTDLSNAEGYSDIVLEINLVGYEYAEFSEYHIFAKNPEDCKVISVYYNGKQYPKEEFLKLNIEI